MLKKQRLKKLLSERDERSQTSGDVVMEGASDGGRTEEDYDGLVS